MRAIRIEKSIFFPGHTSFGRLAGKTVVSFHDKWWQIPVACGQLSCQPINTSIRAMNPAEGRGISIWHASKQTQRHYEGPGPGHGPGPISAASSCGCNHHPNPNRNRNRRLPLLRPSTARVCIYHLPGCNSTPPGIVWCYFYRCLSSCLARHRRRINQENCWHLSTFRWGAFGPLGIYPATTALEHFR